MEFGYKPAIPDHLNPTGESIRDEYHKADEITISHTGLAGRFSSTFCIGFRDVAFCRGTDELLVMYAQRFSEGCEKLECATCLQ